MDSTALIIVGGLYFGAFVTWSTEAFGSLVKIFGMEIKSNLISVSVVQSISIFSRLGFFLQALAIAWIVDEIILIEFRGLLVLGYLAITLFSVYVTHFFGLRVLKYAYNYIISKAPSNNLNETAGRLRYQYLWRPSVLQILGYLMLYMGGFLPILIQLVLPEFAARGVALASIINGVSTIILISYYDLKTSIEINKSMVSDIPAQLLAARYVALFISIAVCITVILVMRSSKEG